MYREVFAERLKKVRKDSGFTQQEVSDVTGISRSVLAKYETGKLEPDLEKLGILCDFYNKPADYFIGRA